MQSVDGAEPLLTSRKWSLKYTPDSGDLVTLFYLPALACATRYDRSTGYFAASALALAMRGIEGLVRNGGRMRLIVGCTLEPAEIAAITTGEELRDAVERHLAARPLEPSDEKARNALELLSWMIQHGILEVKVAIPCDEQRRPLAAEGIFHEKAGVIEDAAGNKIAFNGSINETYAGWKKNWESFSVFTSWSGTADYVTQEEEDFARIWANQAKRVITLDVPEAARADLLQYLPTDDKPARLKDEDSASVDYQPVGNKGKEIREGNDDALPPIDLRRQAWEYVRVAPTLPDGGALVGEATCAVQPWPHQVHAFERLYHAGAPRLLIADEVGLGKTIQAGMLLRQLWLTGRAKRILILTPAAVMRQWQLELREKFNLCWPVYDNGQLTWAMSPARPHGESREVSRTDWYKEPFVIASSHLMRRKDRENELCEDAEPWDLIVLDEAHHARRRGAGSAAEEGPNTLLRLMRRLRDRTKGLLLLTATPMQVDPVEIWDLLDLLGLPDAWGESHFRQFFKLIAKPSPSHAELDQLATMFRASEDFWGATSEAAVARLGVSSDLRSRKILKALRDPSNIPRHLLSADDRATALRVMRAATPVTKLVSRHTRDLLRRYHKAGKLSTPIATRHVDDAFIDMSPAERATYEAMEDYISSTYNQAATLGGKEKNAVGFVMTVYRRRLASSFRALRCTLESRLGPLTAAAARTAGENTSEDESQGDMMDAEEAFKLEQAALELEERSDIEALLRRALALPPDTKARKLVEVLTMLRGDGYGQAMVFTQFTDTMDFLRDFLVAQHHKAGHPGMPAILCFSGRGGEALGAGGNWHMVSRDEVKRRFREGSADVLLCTDAAAEGLNFQFCGALVNYDMPWNPMRVEQRIGRIDRLGQRHPVVRIVNLHYKGTVEADVYDALRKRIGLFQSVVGRLQPILAQLPRTITASVLQGGRSTADSRQRVAQEVSGRIDAIEADGSALDIDQLAEDVLELPVRSAPALDLDALDLLVKRASLLPDGVQVRPLGMREYGYIAPGMSAELRITTNAKHFEEHADSVELWSPGSPLFPDPSVLAEGSELDATAPQNRAAFRALLG